MKQSYSDYFRSIDTHSPVSPEFRIRTVSGATLSLLTLLLIGHLIRSEYSYNLSPTFLDTVRVMPQSPDGLEVEFDITFNHIPCALLATDANDPTGQSQTMHIDKKHRVWKHRLDKDGRTIGRKSRFELGGTLTSEEQLGTLAKAKEQQKTGGTFQESLEEMRKLDEEVDDEEECGTCYGAGEAGECCNTCDDVKRAYRRKQWHIDDISTITQCAHLVRADKEEGEGCNIHGFIALSTGGGNLHFAPDRQWEREGDKKSGGLNMLMGGVFDLNSIIEIFNEQFEQFNVSHTVNKLRFGAPIPKRMRSSINTTSQLEGAVRTVTDVSILDFVCFYCKLLKTPSRTPRDRTSGLRDVPVLPAGSPDGLPLPQWDDHRDVPVLSDRAHAPRRPGIEPGSTRSLLFLRGERAPRHVRGVQEGMGPLLHRRVRSGGRGVYGNGHGGQKALRLEGREKRIAWLIAGRFNSAIQ